MAFPTLKSKSHLPAARQRGHVQYNITERVMLVIFQAIRHEFFIGCYMDKTTAVFFVPFGFDVE